MSAAITTLLRRWAKKECHAFDTAWCVCRQKNSEKQ
ncbi:MAG: hypothetical protein K5657_03925 [Desulfovibrio sp.]|nr:hypothetical protein [Desulfovibrio sp.]